MRLDVYLMFYLPDLFINSHTNYYSIMVNIPSSLECLVFETQSGVCIYQQMFGSFSSSDQVKAACLAS